jgi:anti-sigma B factor antagonist
MAGQRRLAITEIGSVAVVRFPDPHAWDEANIQEIGFDLFQLVDEDGRDRLLLNLAQVEFLCSAALGKLITLNRKLKARGGVLKLSNVRPAVYDIFAMTRLNQLFEIHDQETDALAAF